MSLTTEHENRRWPAPAKLNLLLHVTGRRSDGYHNLQTLFQILDWGDELRFRVNDSGQITRSCNVEGIPESEDICVRAAHLLKNRHGVRSGVHIDLIKRIPMGAGLGGGSSDAATVLLALNHIWSLGTSTRDLADMGLQLGADVPVFVHGHSAWAQGRGEELQSLKLGQRHYVLIFPDFGISTASVFQHPSLKRDSRPVDISEVALEVGRNDCEDVAVKLYPELKAMMQELKDWGEPHMSGTGSTIFLPFGDKKTAISAAQELKCRYNVRAVRGVDQSSVLECLSAW